jgi:hypothetical protein
MPLTTGILSEELLVGSMNSGDGSEISKVMNHPDLFKKLNVIDITSAEFVHAIKVLNFYSGRASILEIFKQARHSKISEGIGGNFTDVFSMIYQMAFDLRAIGSSLTGAGPLMYL